MQDQEMDIRKNIERRTEKKILQEEIWRNNPVFATINKWAENIITHECENTKYKGKIRFFFLIDRQINAFSMEVEGTRVICMTTGTIELVPYLVHEMCQCENFFEKYKSNMEPDEIVKELISYIFLHIILHECGHVFEGHIQYLNALVYDTEVQAYSRIDHMLSQVSMDEKALELAADLYATNYIVEMFLSNLVEKSDILNRVRNIYAAIIFLYLVLAVFSKNTEIDEVCVPITSRINEVVTKVLADTMSFNIDVGDIQMILLDIYPAIAISLYRMTKMKSVDLVDYQDKNFLLEMDKIDKRWNEIKDKVLEFSIWED